MLKKFDSRLPNFDFVYNTVRVRGGLGYSSRAFSGGGTGSRLLNNVLVSENSPVVVQHSVDSVDFNIFYTDGTVDWTQSIPNIGPNNFSVDPVFLSVSDLHLSP